MAFDRIAWDCKKREFTFRFLNIRLLGEKKDLSQEKFCFRLWGVRARLSLGNTKWTLYFCIANLKSPGD